jgi:hypothetical protein
VFVWLDSPCSYLWNMIDKLFDCWNMNIMIEYCVINVELFSFLKGSLYVILGNGKRQTGSRNLTGPKTLPTIWGTYMKPVTKYQISAINSCWEKCDEKCAYMFNVYKDQLSRQTGHFSQQLLMAEIWYLVTSFI